MTENKKLKIDGKQDGKKIFDIKPIEVELVPVKWGDRALISNLSQKITREAAESAVDWRDIGELIFMSTTLQEEDLDDLDNTQVLAICMGVINYMTSGIKKKSRKK